MANADRPFGARVAMTGLGAGHSARVTRYPATGELYTGAFVKFDGSGNVVQASSGDTFVGVCVGVGGSTDSQVHGRVGMFDPDDLTNEGSGKLDTDEDGYAWVMDDPNAIFEIQDSGTLNAGSGDNADITNEASGNDLSGRSEVELTSDTNSDVVIIRATDRPDNDPSEANAEYMVRINPASHAFA